VSDDQKGQQNQSPAANEPIFNLPRVVTALCGMLIAVHLASLILDPIGQRELTLWFGFTPLRFLAGQANPEAWVPLLWTPFTHALLHAGWEHLLVNVAWLAIFATPVARRYGARPTLVIFLVSCAAGAAAFTLTSLSDGTFLVGASGGVAGLTGAAVRFIFQPVLYMRDDATGQPVPVGRRLASLGDVFRNPRSRWFTVIWVALNAAVPLLGLFVEGGGLAIAWQAHLGGFLAGLLLVPLFERRERLT
jgi:membrane associated rhomboid family serine protease